jgi:hypothetical protein
MKKFAIGLVLIVWWSLMTQPAVVCSKPTEWSLYLKTTGAPWEKTFELTLDNTGALNLTEDEPRKMPAPTTSKVEVKLSTKDTQDVYEQTLKAIRAFEFPKKTMELADGTNLTLRLIVHRRAVTIQIWHLGVTDEELPEVAKLFALLNKHLPKEHHVY